MTKKSIKLSLVALTVLSYCHHLQAETTETDSLDTIVVSADSEDVAGVLEKKISETKKTAKQLAKQQVQDAKDLVRYETDVTVVDAGRFGSSGFAIRGVDENRVAIQIDNLAQAQTISSQGFKELFEGYGNFNNTRNSAEIETLKEVRIRKGADSLKSGSGALGGSVSFETKDARDFLTEKDFHIGYKRGYSSADNQNLQSLTLAGRYKYFDALLVATKRRGHELENYDYAVYDGNIQGRRREKADPYVRSLDSTLLKVSFQPNDNHRFTAAADLYKQTSRGHDFSYTLKFSKYGINNDETDLRHTNDHVKRKNYAFTYENFSSNPLWDTLKITYSNQHIRTRARTDDYCHGWDACQAVSNPLGLHYNNKNELVGKDGKSVTYVNKPETYSYNEETKEEKIEIKEEDKKDSYWYYKYKAKLSETGEKLKKEKHADYVSYECKKDGSGICVFTITHVTHTPEEKKLTANGKEYDLTKPENAGLINTPSLYNKTLLSCEGINCDSGKIEVFDQDGSRKELPITTKTINGKKFAELKDNEAKSQIKAKTLITPVSPGYLEDLWSQRDLTTDTKQVNLDLTKAFKIAELDNQLSYGAMWSETWKKMINRSGDSAANAKWWALYPENCSQKTANTDRFNALCNNSNVYSFLIPVKATTNALYFSDEVRVNSYLAFDLGYRYDRIKYEPEYKPGVTPKIPDDMVTNLYVKEPKFNSSNYTDPENQRKRTQNAEANIREIAQKKKFSASSYALGATLDPLDWLRLQAKYSKAFRAPTSDEIYFTYKHPDFSVLPNKDLEAETAKTKEIALTLHKPFGYISTTLFQTDYRNFIDLKFNGRQRFGGGQLGYLIYRNINRQTAKVTGIDVQTKVLLGEIFQPLQGVSLSYKYTYQKGRMEETLPMNAIQPRTSVYGLSYTHPSDKFGFDLYVTHASAKQAKDTYNMYYNEERHGDDKIIAQHATPYIKWRSKAYTLIDIIGFVKPIENLTLQAGVYNLTNEKYLTWDSARSIRPFGTSNMIDQITGQGINRFYAPGRNFKLNAELTF